jgi:hypothetical protein
LLVSLLDELLDHGYRLRFRADRSDMDRLYSALFETRAACDLSLMLTG